MEIKSKAVIQVLLAILFLSPTFAPAQNVILHLRNGDRIGGVILSENTNQVVLSNTWAKELTVPLAQIERREIPTNAPVLLTSTNKFSGTNLVQTGSGKLPVNTNTFWKRWKGEVAIGMDLERGATIHELYYGKAKLTYAQAYQSDPKEFFRNILIYGAEYGKTAGTLSDNRMGGSSKTDFDLTHRLYVYNLGAASYDEIRKIDLHYEEGPGVGYHWINRTNFAVNLETGMNYQVEDRSDGTHTRSAYYRLAEDMMWKVNKQLTWTQKFEYFPRVAYAMQYRMRFESTLSYALLTYLSLNASVADVYDTQPTAGIPNNDFQLRTSLGLKF